MAWAHVQTNGNRPGGTDTSIVHSISSTVTAGSLLVCFVAFGGTSVTCTGVSDDVNGAWTQFPTVSPLKHSLVGTCSCWYFPNSATGTVTVTAALDGSVGARSLIVSEYSGIASTSPYDVGASKFNNNPGTGTDAVTSDATATTASANELAWCAVNVKSSTVTLTVGTNYTQRYNAAGHGTETIGISDQNIASPTTVAGTWTINSTTDDAIVFVGLFKEPSAAGNPWAYYAASA